MTAADSGDLGFVHRTAHKLKGSSRTVGAVRVGELLALIEEETAHGPQPQALALHLGDLRSAHADALRELNGILEAAKATTNAA